MPISGLDIAQGIITVTDLRRDISKVIGQLETERQFKIITQRGRPVAVLVDAVSYQAQQERLALLEKILVGERAIKEGRVVDQAEAVAAFENWLIPAMPRHRYCGPSRPWKTCEP